jgi:hypothetical protein
LEGSTSSTSRQSRIPSSLESNVPLMVENLEVDQEKVKMW